ncbi:MAG: type II secretion system protein GspM [Rudaea sp.]
MIRARLAALPERDRRVLTIGAIVVALLLVWAFIWHPLAQARQQMSARVAADRTALVWMRQSQAKLPGLTVRSTHAGADRLGKSLLALADASARGAGLETALKRVEPSGARSVRVSFEAANFDALIGWIESLARDYGVETSDLSVDRADGLGLVNARVVLEDQQ